MSHPCCVSPLDQRFDFSDLLVGRHIDLKSVLVFRHRPNECALRKALPWLAAEDHDTFNAYQQTQTPRVENAMLKAQYVASFIGHAPGKAVFVGLYAIDGSKPVQHDKFWKLPGYQKLRALGMRDFAEEGGRSTILYLKLVVRDDFYQDWKGKLIIGWPPPEIAWWRRAHQNTFPIEAILEESIFDEAMPKWDEINLRWDELAILPARWKATLSQWRGIYLIFDETDGKGYVGSAYGADNLLGRWRNYAATGHGGNRLLRKPDPHQFRFSILQLLSPTEGVEEVLRVESSWKERLHTRAPQGLNDN
jgi:hypothetical protein